MAVVQTELGEFGLQAGLFTYDLRVIEDAFDRIDVGGSMVNDVSTYRIDHMPYGGVKSPVPDGGPPLRDRRDDRVEAAHVQALNTLPGGEPALPSVAVQRRNYRPPAPTLTGLLEAAAVGPDVDEPRSTGRSRWIRPHCSRWRHGRPSGRSATMNRCFDRCSGCSTDRRRGCFPLATSDGGRSGSRAGLRVSHKMNSRFMLRWRRRRHSGAQRTTLPATTGRAMRSSRRSNSLSSAAATRAGSY